MKNSNMAYYYKIDTPDVPLDGIQSFEGIESHSSSKLSTEFDFSNYVLIELLDDITPEFVLWEELGLQSDKRVLHKRLMFDSHRVHCRRAIVVYANSRDAKNLAQRLNQTKVMRRCVCAVVVHDLLSDFTLFEKQILQFGDRRPQHQFLYVYDLNRGRKPAELAEFLRELFSPFGTILSVFVAEDKDGCAYPEGVIKFAHLSEAFAAEIAYDQYVIGMERLSVTAHHNILLSQCDLRSRLREAQLRNRESLNGKDFSKRSLGIIPEIDSADCSTPKRLKSPSDEMKSCAAVTNGNLADVRELDNVLKNPCQSNLMECLKSIKLCSDGSTSRDTTRSSMSLTNIDVGDNTQNSHFDDKNSSVGTSPEMLPFLEKTWSSRINDWLEDVSILEKSQTVLNGNSVVGDETVGNIDHVEREISPDVASTTCSFVTCVNDIKSGADYSSMSFVSGRTQISNAHSCDDSNSTLKEPSSPDSFHNPESMPDVGMISINGSKDNLNASVVSESSFLNASSQIEKRSTLSLKLSLKNQKVVSPTHFSDSQSTLILPTRSEVPQTNTSSRDEPKVFKSPVVRLKKLTALEIQKFCYPSSQNEPQGSCTLPLPSYGGDSDLKISSNFSGKIVKTNSVKSCPIRRSSRFTSQPNFTSSKSDIFKKCKSSQLAEESDRCNEIDSPLRAWLKKELAQSSNNRVFGSLESSRKIVCATAKKDVLASVGCSHMTCDACYPGSTNLLLGCH